MFVIVINVTPDSFCDGGLFSMLKMRFSKCYLVDAGEIIDIGAESTAPNACHRSVTEWSRLEPVLRCKKKNIFSSAKNQCRHATRYHPRKLSRGWIGLMCLVCDCDAGLNADCVVMHHGAFRKPRKRSPLNQDPVKFTYEWCTKTFR